MPKNIVICLDGTNNKVRGSANTNVVRLFDMLYLREPRCQEAYYGPGVGTFSSPAAWTPAARLASRVAGLAFGAGLRQNLAEAYLYLMSVYEPDDRVFLFGFSRGAYTIRALSGLLDTVGLLRRGAENLVPYVVSEYARNGRTEEVAEQRFKVPREYARIFSRAVGNTIDRTDHFLLHFVGLWDTVKAAGDLRGEWRWPYTAQMPHVSVVRHAIAIDEWRRPYRPYRVYPTGGHLIHTDQDLKQVWFSGVHSDVGGVFDSGTRLSDLPLKWIAQEAVRHGLWVRPRKFKEAQQVDPRIAIGPVHRMNLLWRVLGTRRRRLPQDALIHASVARRIENDQAYRQRVPATATVIDQDWDTSLMPAPRTPQTTSTPIVVTEPALPPSAETGLIR